MEKIQGTCTGSRREPYVSSGRISAVDLECETERLLDASLSESTKQAYKNALSIFENFRVEYDLQNVWPPPVSHVSTFIAFLSLRKKSHNTVSSYLSAINYRCKRYQQNDFSDNFIVRKMIEGMRRVDKRKDARLPITQHLLSKIISVLPIVCSSQYEAVLFSSAFSLSFHGFLRVGEVALNKPWQSHLVLSYKNVKIVKDKGVDVISVFFQYSKSDQSGKGNSIKVPGDGSCTCPLRLLVRYLEIRPKTEGQLFVHFGGSPITRNNFTGVLNKALKCTGIDSSNIRSHSFRIGACSSHFDKGTSTEEIKRLGRWKSDAYKRYIR